MHVPDFLDNGDLKTYEVLDHYLRSEPRADFASGYFNLGGYGLLREALAQTPEGPFDLIVASEILYYFTEEVMLAALRRFEEKLAPGGSLLAVHWRGEPRTHPLRGDEVHDLLDCHTRFTNVLAATEPEYRLDLFRDTGDGP